VKLFLEEGGYKFSANDVLKISAAYDNPTGKLLRDGAMESLSVILFPPMTKRWPRCGAKQNPPTTWPRCLTITEKKVGSEQPAVN